MKHVHKSTGLTFECGELIDRSDNSTFDITVITFWYEPAEDDDDVAPPIIIGYYFGDYDRESTDYYIDQWLKTVRDCKDVVDAYWLTNEDLLEEPWLSKALNAIDTFKEVERRFPLNQVGGDNNA